jgi:hypothetical protein
MKKGPVNHGLTVIRRGFDKHSGIILTISSIIGLGAVAITTSRAAVKADREICDKIFDAEEEGTVLTNQEKAKIYLKHYWPVFVAIGGEVFVIIFNHKKNSKKIELATAACGLYKDAYVTLKEKVREKIGDDAARELDADIVMDKAKQQYPNIDPALIPGSGVIFVESITGQVFRSSVDEIMREAKRFNEDLVGMDWLCINEWLGPHLGLNEMDGKIGYNLGFAERYGHDGLNVYFTPSDKLFATGETATAICYDDELVAERDFTTVNAL